MQFAGDRPRPPRSAGSGRPPRSPGLPPPRPAACDPSAGRVPPAGRHPLSAPPAPPCVARRPPVRGVLRRRKYPAPHTAMSTPRPSAQRPTCDPPAAPRDVRSLPLQVRPPPRPARPRPRLPRRHDQQFTNPQKSAFSQNPYQPDAPHARGQGERARDPPGTQGRVWGGGGWCMYRWASEDGWMGREG